MRPFLLTGMPALQTFRPWLLLAACMLAAWFAYTPGLGGTFHFDDFANLPILGAMGPIDNWPAFWRYITAGAADPTGRPVALLTFLLDARDWPADAWPFLRTNVILHLLNGTLLAILLMLLGRTLSGTGTAQSKRAAMAAALGAALWTLHPLFVSTTLYIVQREAMLPATFCLAGLILWLAGREQLARDRLAPGLALIALGLGGGTLLATLSKANGALLPALALAIEVVALRRLAPLASARPYRNAMMLFACLPALLVVAYLAYAGWSGLIHGTPEHRPWSLGQRLLTQPRVIAEYLNLLWLPRPYSAGLFNDQVVASKSLVHPWTTLPSILLVGALITGAWAARRRFPLAALTIGFYFTGHLIESTTIALELQFEHRNYLPALLMFWPLAAWLCNWRPSAPETPPSHARFKYALAFVLVAGLAGMTFTRASLWGDHQSQALMWAGLNPHSARAQAYAAGVETADGRTDQAARRLRSALVNAPDDVQLSLGLFSAQCAAGHVEEATLERVKTSLSTTRNVGGLLASWFGNAISSASAPPCPQLTLDQLKALVSAARSNPHLPFQPGQMQDLAHVLGRIALARGDAETALGHFNRALEVQVREGFALQQASLLGAAGQPQLGLAHLDHYAGMAHLEYVPKAAMPRLHAWVLRKQDYWPTEHAHLREVLRQDLRAKEATSELE